MNEQPGDLLSEAGKLFEAMRRRWSETGGGTGREPGDDGDDRPGAEDTSGDVWGQVVAEVDAADQKDRSGGREKAGEHAREHAREQGPRIATGAPECLDCPVCRAIAAARESGGDVQSHLRDAGRSLMEAAMDLAAAFERARGQRGGRAGRSRDAGREEPGDIG